MLILFQSCVVYNKQASTIEQASETKNRLIKIRTIDGVKYKLDWIEDEGGNIVNIKNAKREYISKSEITQIVKFDPEPHVIPVESPLTQNGALQILTKDKKGNYKSREFIKIEEQGDLVRGYRMTGNDTLTTVIPIGQIEKIQLQNKGGSAVLTLLIIFGVTNIVAGILWLAEGGMEMDLDFSQ